jgi:hypothetical protein
MRSDLRLTDFGKLVHFQANGAGGPAGQIYVHYKFRLYTPQSFVGAAVTPTVATSKIASQRTFTSGVEQRIDFGSAVLKDESSQIYETSTPGVFRVAAGITDILAKVNIANSGAVLTQISTVLRYASTIAALGTTSAAPALGDVASHSYTSTAGTPETHTFSYRFEQAHDGYGSSTYIALYSTMTAASGTLTMEPTSRLYLEAAD